MATRTASLPSKTASLPVTQQSSQQGDDLVDLFAFLENPPNEVRMSFSSQLSIQEMGSGQVPMAIDAGDFEQPCEPFVTSGGTAAFYGPMYKKGTVEPIDKFIGKDFGRTADEFDFYQKMKAAAMSERCWYDFARIAVECPGVVHLQCKVPVKKDDGAASPTPQTDKSAPPDCCNRPLLLLENLNSGFKKMRLIDLKLGEETAVAGWKGKSRMRAQVNGIVDSMTNSTAEGFRLEGIDNPPNCLEQYLQLNSKFLTNQSYAGAFLNEKRARRWCMQRLRGSDVLNYWLALQEDEPDTSRRRRTESELEQKISVTKEQHVHQAIWQTLDHVGKVLETVLAIPVPQMWIGSSLGVMLETGEISQTPLVKVKVFDWGRSDMTLAGEYMRLSPTEKKDRVTHWRMYLRSLLRFQFELLRLAAHRCCCRQWTAIVCDLCVEQQSISGTPSVGGDVACCGMYELPATGPPLITRRVRLPLKVKGIQVPCATLTLMVKCRKLDANQSRFIAEIRTLENVANVVQQQRPDIEAVSVRVTAFELKEDAKTYVQGWHDGVTDGMRPKGKVFSQKTTPKGFEASTEGMGVAVTWTDALEFMAFGEQYEDAQRRLTAASFVVSDASMLAQSMVATQTLAQETERLKSISHTNQTWPSHTPPTISSQKDVDRAFRAFSTWIAVHSLDDGPWLPAWS